MATAFCLRCVDVATEGGRRGSARHLILSFPPSIEAGCAVASRRHRNRSDLSVDGSRTEIGVNFTTKTVVQHVHVGVSKSQEPRRLKRCRRKLKRGTRWSTCKRCLLAQLERFKHAGRRKRDWQTKRRCRSRCPWTWEGGSPGDGPS